MPAPKLSALLPFCKFCFDANFTINFYIEDQLRTFRKFSFWQFIFLTGRLSLQSIYANLSCYVCLVSQVLRSSALPLCLNVISNGGSLDSL